QVGRATRQGAGAGAGRIEVAVDGPVGAHQRRAGGGAGQRAAGGEVGGVHGDGVGARRLGEQVVAGGVGGGVVGDGDAGAVGAGQGQGDARDAQFAGVLDAVGVRVAPHEVADRNRLVVTEVQGEVGGAAGEGGGGGAGRVGIAVV